MQGKTIWITGASSGIGRALSLEMSARGANVVITARRESELHAVRAACAHPDRVHVLPGDLLDPDAWAPLAEAAAGFSGPVEVVVHNAGISQRTTAENMPLTEVRRLMELNFFAPVALTNLLLPAMRSMGRGRVVVISSVTGYIGTPLRSSYSASKHALRGYFDSLRAELHDTGIGVTIVCPGYIQTDIAVNSITDGGATHGKRDKVIEKGMPAEVCARRIADGIEAGKSELLIGGKETFGVYVKRLFPRLVERMVPGMAPE